MSKLYGIITDTVKYKYDFNLAILVVSLKFGRRNRLLRQRSSRKDY